MILFILISINNVMNNPGGAPGHALLFLQRWYSGRYVRVGSSSHSSFCNGGRQLNGQVHYSISLFTVHMSCCTSLFYDCLWPFQALFKLSGFHTDRWQQWICGFPQIPFWWRGSLPKTQAGQQDSERTQPARRQEARRASQKQQVVKSSACERHVWLPVVCRCSVFCYVSAALQTERPALESAAEEELVVQTKRRIVFLDKTHHPHTETWWEQVLWPLEVSWGHGPIPRWEGLTYDLMMTRSWSHRRCSMRLPHLSLSSNLLLILQWQKGGKIWARSGHTVLSLSSVHTCIITLSLLT